MGLVQAATALLGLLGIFLLPWFVPQGQPVCSASYTLGFNNIAASLAFAATLAALFVLRLRRPGGATEGLVAGMLSSRGARAGSRSAQIAFGVTTTLTVAVLLAWYRIMPYSQCGEFGLDVSRLDLMVLGMKPYRDFQYNYGPAMFYPAYWLYQVCGSRLSIDGALFATLLGHWVAGLSLLYYTARTLCGGWHATVVFVCAALAAFSLSMGVGYTPLRFVAPIASFLFLHRTFGRWQDNDRAGLLKSAVVAMLLSLGSLALSPEIGVATAAGITAFFLSFFFTPLRRFAVVAAAPLAALGIAVLVLSVNYTEGVFSVGGGANNFPVFPTLPLLLHVAAGSLILPRLGVIGVRERNRDGALALALVVGLGILTPAAFGRCDQSHVLFNGIGVLILCLAVAARQSNRAAAVLMLGAFVVVHLIVGKTVMFQGNGSIRRALDTRERLAAAGFDERKNGETWSAASGADNRLRYGKLYPFQPALLQLLRYEAVGTPFFPGEEIDRFLKLSGRFVPEYYAGSNMQVYTPSDVSRKIRDLRAMSVLIVPKDHRHYPVVVDESDARWLSDLLFFPSWLIPEPRRKPYIPGLEVMKHIEDNFSVVGELGAFDIWRRNGR